MRYLRLMYLRLLIAVNINADTIVLVKTIISENKLKTKNNEKIYIIFTDCNEE